MFQCNMLTTVQYAVICCVSREIFIQSSLVSGQLCLWTPFQIPVLPPSQTLYLHIPVSGHSLVGGRGHF